MAKDTNQLKWLQSAKADLESDADSSYATAESKKSECVKQDADVEFTDMEVDETLSARKAGSTRS